MATPETQRWRAGDHCITPKGETAVVMSVAGNFLTLRYRDALPGSSAAEEFQLNVKLCAKCVPGLFRPPPVVVGDAAEVQRRTKTFRRSRW